MRIMITGGAGYIGNELVYRLSAEPGIDDILVYDNLCKGNYNLFTGLRKVPGNNVRFIQADILDSRSLRSCMAGMDIVIHLAARVEAPFADQNAHDFEQTNHWGTSAAHPRVPASFYGLSKMRGEDHVLRLMEKTPVQLVRCANVYGYSKNLRFETLVNQLVFDAHFTRRVAIHGDPGHTMSHISLYHLVEVLAQMVKQDMDSDVYNLSQRAMATGELLEALKALYPDLETIFVDQHIPLKDLTIACDQRLSALRTDGGTMLDDLVKFRELFTF